MPMILLLTLALLLQSPAAAPPPADPPQELAPGWFLIRGVPMPGRGPDGNTVIIDAPVAKQQAEELGGIEIVEKVPTDETYGIAVEKGNDELIEQINEGLKKAIADGSYAKVYEKWFKEAPPLEGLEEAIEEAESK